MITDYSEFENALLVSFLRFILFGAMGHAVIAEVTVHKIGNFILY